MWDMWAHISVTGEEEFQRRWFINFNVVFLSVITYIFLCGPVTVLPHRAMRTVFFFSEPAKSSCGRMDITDARKLSVSLVTKELVQWHEAAVISLSLILLSAVDLQLFSVVVYFILCVCFHCTILNLLLWCTCPETDPHFSHMCNKYASFEWVKSCFHTLYSPFTTLWWMGKEVTTRGRHHCTT